MRRSGFTLLEMLIVLAILSIMLSIGFVWYIRYQRLEEFRASVSQVVSDLNEIRSESRRTAFHWRLTRTSSTTYTLGTTTLVKRTMALPPAISFDIANSAANVQYLTPYGNVEAANNTLRLVRADPNLAAKINIVGVTGKVVAVYE